MPNLIKLKVLKTLLAILRNKILNARPFDSKEALRSPPFLNIK
jgi:hypothetical protein